MAVLLFHVDYLWLAGGFVGVDVFFVISGFLITRNVVRDIGAGQFEFSAFYLRRIARLFPALFVTITLTLGAGYFLLSPDDLERLGRVGVLSALSVGNIFFWLEAGYFDATAATKPLLHTWSLAVEEQFYMIWPLFLFLLAKWGGRALLAGIVVSALGSLVAASYVFIIDPTASFFLTPLRIYQFALGGILACSGLCQHRLLSNLAFAVGFLFVACAALMGQEDSPYWLIAVMPAFGAAAMIYGSCGSFSANLMTVAPAVWLGQRSYSIYLAHWPIIVYWKMATDFEFTDTERVFALVASVGVGAVLYQLVERPFRSRKGQKAHFRNGVLVGVLGFGVGILTSGAHLWGLDGVPSRIPPEIASATKHLKRDWDERLSGVRNGQCNFPMIGANPEAFDRAVCITPPATSSGSKGSYLILGDSFASDAYLIFSTAFPDTHFGQITVPGCFLRMPKQITPEQQQGCRALYEKGFEIARHGDFDGVILSSNWQAGHYYRIDELIKSLERNNFRVIVIGQRLRFKERIPAIVATSLSLRDANQKAMRLALEEPREINRTILTRFSGRAEIFDMYSLQNDVLGKVVSDSGEVLYLDDRHVSLAGARELGRTVRESFPDMFAVNAEP